MKKIYLQPEMEVVLLHTVQPLLTGSVTETLDVVEEMPTGSFGARELDDLELEEEEFDFDSVE